MVVAVTVGQLHFEGDRGVLLADGLGELQALRRVGPDAQLNRGTANGFGGGPAQLAFEAMVGLADQAVFDAHQQDHVW